MIDPDVVETACLAHDLGHPPFGHSGETVLAERLKTAGSFEGNAQTFRIVTHLSFSLNSGSNSAHPSAKFGLNLTDRSLNAILKYPQRLDERGLVLEARKSEGCDEWWNRGFGAKWGAYHSEQSAFEFARDGQLSNGANRYLRSPEAIIMDWADDISFASHDLDDYFRAGLIPLESMGPHEESFRQFVHQSMQKEVKYDENEMNQAIDWMMQTVSAADRAFDYSQTSQKFLALFVNSVLERLSAGCTPLDKAPFVQVSKSSQYEAEALKKLTQYFVIQSAPTSIARAGQTSLVSDLFGRLYDWTVIDPSAPRLPRQLLVMYSAAEKTNAFSNSEAMAARVVSDYLCSLTEAQTVDMAQRFNGSSQASMFGSWF